MNQDSYSVLLVSDDSKTISVIKTFLIAPIFNLTVTGDFYDASRISEVRKFDFIIADSNDGSETEFATNVSGSDATVLLLVPNEHFEEISYRVESYGVMTIIKPFEPFYFYNMMKVAIAMHYKIQALSQQTVKLKTKMEEIRIVNRAKFLLIEKRGMTEQQAHHYLEKEAMDKGLKRITVAQQIVSDYE